MSEEITVSYTFDADVLIRAFWWHHRRKYVRRILVYVTAFLFMLGSFYSGLNSGHGVPTQVYVWGGVGVLVFFFVLWQLIQLINRFFWRRRINAMPLCGKQVTWTVTESALKCVMSGADATMDWSVILESVATPEGILIYPQKNLFYWLPRTAFTTESEYIHFRELVASKTKHSKLG
ncbi:MAG: YcxB family protein [Prosthecobacter sp.]|uniref:YcxB family protein n=1 Tax=Prosthecobacter sp. TaxID=1965333 RepID=UPI0025E61DA8|nr:YcxB family protein [Prosthecobacter sp.]MCF7786059.1 YcxB family protein [Prosthecobacter sp.]